VAFQRITIKDLPDDENTSVNVMLEQIESKTRRNLLRRSYYESKHAVRQVAAILPPAYSTLATTVGWTAKAVDMLNRRCNVDTFTWTGGDLASLGFNELWSENSLGSEIGQGSTASLIHASAFVSTTAGEAGEPDVGIHFFDALDATGIWNARTRRLSAGLVIDARNKDGVVIGLTLHLPGVVVTCEKSGPKWSVTDRAEHGYGMTLDLLPYRPRTGRAFGASRISRPMMAIQDMAIRELLRLEGHMDVYSFPEMWMLGADLSIFGDNVDPFQVMLGRIKGIPDDEDAVNPRVDVKQFAASSPEPHLAALNAHAKLFARESGLPDSSLAITQMANPTSAESYDAAQHDLIAEAEGAQDDWTPALAQVGARALAMKAKDPSLIATLEPTLRPKWRPAQFLSRAAEADAGMKQLSVMPWLAETSVGLELLGLSDEQARRADAERKRAEAAARVSGLLNAGESDLDIAASVKAKAEAMGMLIRSGADPEDAAERVGMPNLKFTGATPVTLRQPVTDAAKLEDK